MSHRHDCVGYQYTRQLCGCSTTRSESAALQRNALVPEPAPGHAKGREHIVDNPGFIMAARSRRPTDADTDAGKITAFQMLDQGADAVVAARSSAPHNLDAACRQVQIVVQHDEAGQRDVDPAGSRPV